MYHDNKKYVREKILDIEQQLQESDSEPSMPSLPVPAQVTRKQSGRNVSAQFQNLQKEYESKIQQMQADISALFGKVTNLENSGSTESLGTLG